MKKHNLIAAGAALPVLVSLACAPALAAGTGPKVSVRVEGLNKTLLPAKTITAPANGSITKGGAQLGQCPAKSAQGALGTATRGRWTGKWYASYKEYEVTGILGTKPNPNKDYFEIFVNNVAATAGACEIKLKPGEKLLFAEVPSSGKPETPLGVSAKASGSTVTAKVVAYSAKGKAAPLKGATVKLGSATATTNAAGVATLKTKSAGTVVATAKGHIRAEATTAK